jgi:hypothetical protein
LGIAVSLPTQGKGKGWSSAIGLSADPDFSAIVKKF